MNVSNNNQSEASTYFSSESTLSQYDIEAWFEAQYDTLKPHTGEMMLHILDNADFGSMYTDRLDEERNVLVVPIKPDYFSQHIPLESAPLQYLVLIEDGAGGIVKGNLFLYFPEDPLFEEIPSGGIRDFYYNAQQFLDQSGKLKIVTLSDLKSGKFEYEAGVLHTSTVLSSEWDEAGSIEYERRCQDWHVVRYYFDLQTGEILDSEVIAEGNTCDNECPPGDMFCDEGLGGWVGTEEPTSEDAEREITVPIYYNSNFFGLDATVKLKGKKFDSDLLNYFTDVPTSTTILSNSLTCISTQPYYCDDNDTRRIIPVSQTCNAGLSLDAKTANASITIVIKKTNVGGSEHAFTNSFTWTAKDHLF